MKFIVTKFFLRTGLNFDFFTQFLQAKSTGGASPSTSFPNQYSQLPYVSTLYKLHSCKSVEKYSINRHVRILTNPYTLTNHYKIPITFGAI